MQALKELIYIINRNKLRAVGVIALPFAKESKLNTLYEGINQGLFQTDEDAARAIFNTEQADSNYRKLKAKLLHRLTNALFFIDLKKPSYTTRQRAYQECHKNWAAVKILFGENAREAGVDLAKKILSQAEKYEFTHLCMDIAKTLRVHYGAMLAAKKEYNLYKTLYNKYFELYALENYAEESYTELMMQQADSKISMEQIGQQAEVFYQELMPALEKYDTHDLLFYSSLLKLIASTAVHDYSLVLEICDKAIESFELKQFVARMPLQVFQYQKIVCLIQLRQTNEKDFASLIAKKPKFLKEGTYNWYRFQEAYIILGLHTQHYQKAYDLFLHGIKHKRFEFLPPDQQEYWRILEAYLFYLHEIGKIDTQGERYSSSKFWLGKFLNQTQISAKDKRGMNVTILIIQIILLINQKKWGKTLDKIESIEQYCSRYLHKPDTIRAYYFMKMLLTLPKNNFHREAVARKSANYFKHLQKHALEIGNQSFFMEIILFEDLWKMILENLNNQFARIPKSNAERVSNN
ncbi:MAG: hypothetical protein IPJ74_22545 [Saprospiraceae bacterium]|nr:hypothetical protein [Saprospiraceae bacterium]